MSVFRTCGVVTQYVLSLFVALLFVMPLGLPDVAWANSDRVIDEVNVLTDSEEQSLEAEIANLVSRHRQDIVILFADLNGKTPMARADDYFDENGYGIGEQRSGVLLLVSPSSRDWWISTSGESIPTFTDRSIEAIGNDISSSLGDEKWADACHEFLEHMDAYMQAYRGGTPLNGGRLSHKDMPSVVVSTIIGALAGGVLFAKIVVRVFFVSKMKNIGRASRSEDIMAPGTFQVLAGSEQIISRSVSRTPRAISSDSSGSSTHRSSSGATHGGGGGKF
ncbi:TPM domain-containing protein [Schaalia suimastitidis]|uniref:TPM domain-containing protein n=1 Tax=Schaalia suimastitidis TaxID=121163 RepID=UPI00041DE577|nr:TPM domain-containing protein [Schaalia suimastitidis]